MEIPFQLKPFDEPSFQVKIAGSVERNESGICIIFDCTGDLSAIQLPERAQSPVFKEGLWENTCFECFVRPANSTQYIEWNFSPSGDWWSAGFSGYREMDPDYEPIAPFNSVARMDAHFQLSATLSPPFSSPMQLGLSAVVQDRSGKLSYWALNHPQAKPDFHHPDSFQIRL